VISFDPAAAAGMIRFAEDESDAMLFGFSFEHLRDELFPIVDIDLPGNLAFFREPTGEH